MPLVTVLPPKFRATSMYSPVGLSMSCIPTFQGVPSGFWPMVTMFPPKDSTALFTPRCSR
jgi:hypothetical protein